MGFFESEKPLELMMTKQQVIDEKSRGRFSDPNSENIFRLNLLSDWLILYNKVEKLERECCQLHCVIRELESEAQS